MPDRAAAAERLEALPLFPLRTVLFPGGLLPLKIFEARYLDMIGSCLRSSAPFGVVCLKQGDEVQRGAEDNAQFESCGVLAELIEVDSEQAGILQVRCRGTRRFELLRRHRQPDGLWLGDVELHEPEPPVAPTEALAGSAGALALALASLREQGETPALEPYQYDDAGWVANRWCEILPIPLAAKQKLMALDEPLLRLQLVDDFLRSRGVVR